MMKTLIPVYAVNLTERTDRRTHIYTQFAKKSEFDLHIINAVKHERGATGLWMTIQRIVRIAMKEDHDYFILCEDDHTFTEHYSPEYLKQSIREAEALEADLLSGGYSWFANAVQISQHLFWSDQFNGMQFTVIWKKFYSSILSADFGENVITDYSLSGITDKKFVIYPYISTQKEFGYSDVTAKNNQEGYVDEIFQSAVDRLEILDKVRKFYHRKLLTLLSESQPLP